MFSATTSMSPSSCNSNEASPRHQSHSQNDRCFSIPLYAINYLQCIILLYFFVFTVHYDERYGGNPENIQVTSAVFDSNSNELTLILFVDSLSPPREIFLEIGSSDSESLRNEIQLELKKPPVFADSPQIFMWSSIEDGKPESLTINAEHPKTALLNEHTGHPSLELSLQEPHGEFQNVVSCFSPISGSFDMVLAAVTSSISMGSFVNIPYEELIEEFHNVLKVFERYGNLHLTAFPFIRHQPHFHFTSENYHLKILKLKADLAHLHCWLMHKSRAKFIIFQNSAESVLPISTQLENPSYISEFIAIFEASRVEGLDILEYNLKVSSDQRPRDFPDFSIRQTMESLKTDEYSGNAKTFIMKIQSPENQNLFSTEKMYSSLEAAPSSIPKTTIDKVGRVVSFIEESDAFWTLKKECSQDSNVWKCSSSKCVRPVVRHRSLHGLYSYNIHFSIFWSVERFDCLK